MAIPPGTSATRQTSGLPWSAPSPDFSVAPGVYWRQFGSGIMNLYEVTLHDTESIYLLAPTKYRALELVGDYMTDAGALRVLDTGKLRGAPD